MPERDKAVDDLARNLVEADRRRPGEALGSQPNEVGADAWDQAQTTADRLYVDLVESLDFTRILIEARKRHLTLHEGEVKTSTSFDIGIARFTDFCGECMTEVMLATATSPPWAVEPESPRYLRYVDPQGPEMVTLVVPGTAPGDEDEGWED